MSKTMLPEGTLEGQTAVITGGGSGIGFGIAQELTRLGPKVVLAGRKQEKLDAAAEKINNDGGEAFGVATDVRLHFHQRFESRGRCVGHEDIKSSPFFLDGVEHAVNLFEVFKVCLKKQGVATRFANFRYRFFRHVCLAVVMDGYISTGFCRCYSSGFPDSTGTACDKNFFSFK